MPITIFSLIVAFLKHKENVYAVIEMCIFFTYNFCLNMNLSCNIYSQRDTISIFCILLQFLLFSATRL